MISVFESFAMRSDWEQHVLPHLEQHVLPHLEQYVLPHIGAIFDATIDPAACPIV